MQPDSLEAKFKLLALLPYDQRVRRKHMLVFGFILDWYHRKYGDALASVRHVHEQLRQRDPEGQGASIALIHSALADLVAWGWLALEKGSGRQANRYVPVWDRLSVHPVPNTTEDGSSVHPGMNAGVHPGLNATGISVYPAVYEDPLTGPGHKTGGQVSTYEVPAPLGGGAEGATPAVGFEEVWKAYGRHGNKKASCAAWEAIEWSRYDFGPEHVIERARSWAASAKPGQRRMPLEKWLEAEKFDEADRAVEPKARKTDTVKSYNEPPTPANDNRPAATRHTVRITEAWINRNSQCTLLSASLERLDGQPAQPRVIHIAVEDYERAVQERGQIEFEQLLTALDLLTCEEPEELVGRPFDLVISGDGEREFHSINPQRERAHARS